MLRASIENMSIENIVIRIQFNRIMVLTLATVQGIVAHLSAYDRESLQCICWLIFSVRSNCRFFLLRSVGLLLK